MTYSSSVATARSSYIRQNQNTISFTNRSKRLGPVSNTMVLLILSCLLGLLYLTQVTKTSSYGYTINNLQKQQAQLQDDQSNLQVTAARLQSLSRVSSSHVAANLVSTTPSGAVRN